MYLNIVYNSDTDGLNCIVELLQIDILERLQNSFENVLFTGINYSSLSGVEVSGTQRLPNFDYA